MALIGMAIVAVPRSVFRAIVWLVMGAVGWFIAAIEAAVADVTATFNSANGMISVYADGDAYGDCVSIYVDNDSVLVTDFGAGPNTTVMTDDASDVTSILVHGSDNGDSIRLDAVTEANGFTGISGLSVTLLPSSGNDSIVGSGFADCIGGDQGNDLVWGADGDDCILGHAGNDCLFGQDGHDRIFGGAGNDSIHGGSDEDSLQGGTGADSMAGGVDVFGETGDHLWHNTEAAGSSPDGSSDSLWGGNFGDTNDEDPYTASEEEFPTDPDYWNGAPVG